jgi:chromosome segregation ATPase
MSIITKVIAVLVLLLLLTSGGFNVYLAFRDHSLSGQVTSLTTANGTLKKDLSEAQASIDAQNTAIENAKAKSAQDQATMTNLSKQLQDQQTSDSKIIADLKKQPAPKTCQDTINYLNQEMGIFTW